MVDKETFDWKKYLLECLNSTNFCALASIDEENGVWVNPVYFAFDEHFNFYFISLAPSRHMQNIGKNEKVALAIYKTEQKGEVIGSQIIGRSRILDDKEEIEEAGKVYYGRKGILEQNGEFQHDPNWIFVKITPDNIYYFNNAVFGEERQEVPEEVLS